MNQQSDTINQAPGDPHTIERQNAQIRADMDETLNALERKLSPGQLLDRVLGMVKEHGGEVATNLGRSVKANPMPALLTVIGISWLMAAKKEAPAAYEADALDEDSSSVREKLDGMKESIGSASAHVRESVGAARDGIRRSAASVRDTMHSAADRTRAAADTVRQQTIRAKESFGTLLEEQPLAAGAIAVAVGAALAALLPTTKVEGRLMGDARERTMNRAREEGRKQYEKARDTTMQAADAAMQAANNAMNEEQRAH